MNTGAVSHSMVPYLDFLAKEGAVPTPNHLTTLINNWDTLHGVDIVAWLVNNGIQVDRSRERDFLFKRERIEMLHGLELSTSCRKALRASSG